MSSDMDKTTLERLNSIIWQEKELVDKLNWIRALLLVLIVVAGGVALLTYENTQVPCQGTVTINGQQGTASGWTTRSASQYCVVSVLGTQSVVTSTWVG